MSRLKQSAEPPQGGSAVATLGRVRLRASRSAQDDKKGRISLFLTFGRYAAAIGPVP